MKTKTICLLFLFVALSVKGIAQGANKTENPFSFWLENADSVSCKGIDTVSMDFFKTAYTRLYCEVPFTSLKEVWVVLQHEGIESLAWKLDNEYFPVGLEKAIQQRGVGTRITVSVKRKTAPNDRGYAMALVIK
jgi:hypothetical protein